MFLQEDMCSRILMSLNIILGVGSGMNKSSNDVNMRKEQSRRDFGIHG